MRRLVSHLRSQAIAYLALFVALGGTAYAASLPANSVGTKQLKPNAVTTAKIRNEAISTDKVQDSTLLARDFASGVLLQGPVGPEGPSGPPGKTGEIGGVDTTILWAVVKGGTGAEPAAIARGKHAVSATRTSVGQHEVVFDRAIDKCAFGVTLGGDEPVAIPGSWAPTSISANTKIGDPTTVMVTVAYMSGGFPTGLDASFHLTVAC